MRITHKLILAAAASLSLNAAMAATDDTFVSGSGVLNFADNGLLQAKLFTISTPATVVVAGTSQINAATYYRQYQTVNVTFNAGSISDGLASLTSTNTAIQMSRTFYETDDDGVLLLSIAKTVSLTDLTIDLSQARIYADLSISSYQFATGQTTSTSYGKSAIFDIDVTGQYSGTPGSFRLDASVQDAVLNGLLTSSDQPISTTVYTLGTTSVWGVVTTSANFTSSVPEPSSWVLMLVGAASIAALRRARLKAA